MLTLQYVMDMKKDLIMKAYEAIFLTDGAGVAPRLEILIKGAAASD